MIRHSCNQHVAEVVMDVVRQSDMLQAKVRLVHPSTTNVSHCEICDKPASYHMVPINFSEEE